MSVPLKANSIPRLTRCQALLIASLAALFWHYSRQPLHHTDLWGHLAYGRWIAEHRELPATEPFMPLARDAVVIDTAWLSQLIAYGVHTVVGLAGLQILHALSITLCCGLLTWPVARRTHRFLVPAVAFAVFVGVERFQFRVIRPQIAGLVGFVGLMTLLSTRSSRRHAIWAVPLLFVAWANLHGSFITGIGLMGMLTCGRAVDVARRTRSLRRVGRDRKFRWLVRLILCAAIAVVINPYGMRLYGEVLAFSQNPNLRDLLEWRPLNFATWQGKSFLTVVVLTVVAAIAARRKNSAESWLPIVLFGAATVLSARMIVWWAPLAATMLAMQLATVWGRWRSHHNSVADGQEPGTDGRPAGERWSNLVSAVVVVGVVADSLMRILLTRGVENSSRLVSRETPIAAVAWLRAHPPTGLVFNTYDWGDYLVWAGPPGVGPFVTTNVHLIPPDVWQSYRAIARADPESLDRLDAQPVDTVLLDRVRHQRLADQLELDRRWSCNYNDDQAVVYSRRSEATSAAMPHD